MMAFNHFHFRREVCALFLLVLPYSGKSWGQSYNQNRSNYFFSNIQRNTLAPETKAKLLWMEYRLLANAGQDSLTYTKLGKIAEASSALDDTLFMTVGAKGLALAKRLEDPSLIGDAHWNYGIYYLQKKRYDSSYYHYHRAYKNFIQAQNNYYAGKMLFNMAYISSQVYYYTGAEIHLFQAIKLFERANRYTQLYECFNLLGTIADDMEEYGRAIDYYAKAGESLEQLEEPLFFQLELWNNLGVCYHKLKNYQRALDYFDKSLANGEELKNRPSLYAKLVDNKAFSELARQPGKNVKDFLEEALEIRDSIGDTSGSVISRMHLAIFYAQKGDTLRAVNHAKNAFALASDSHLNRDVLKALEELALLDKENAVNYQREHIALSKSLYRRERNLRNKFTAIRYETEKYIHENKRLFKERLRIIFGGVTVTVLLFLIYLNTRQRAKNKELLLEMEHRQYNEDMFLMALEQKTNLERGRNEERLRISQELHDGILARLFAVRFKWSFLKVKGDADVLKEHRKSIDLLTDIETEIRNISHDLRNQLIWEEIGFLCEIERSLKELCELGKINFKLECKDGQPWENLDILEKINITRMLDEMIHNVIKHAHAKEIILCFKAKKEKLIFSMADDGNGFTNYNIKKGIGIKNLKNRAEKLRGKMVIHSKEGGGTKIKIEFSRKI